MMSSSGKQKAKYIRAMFSRIAGRYDFMNRMMTGGQDKAWRKFVIERVGLSPHARILDLGTGTGDLLFEAHQKCPDCMGIGGDFTLEMMRVGRQKQGMENIQWVGVDALNLPFDNQAFDAVVSGFLLRNVIDLDLALDEQYRILKPGGIMVALDTTRPPDGLIGMLMRIYLRLVIPLLGRLVTGQVDAYRYLPESTSEFITAEALAGRLVLAGFSKIAFVRRMFGAIAIHWGIK